MVLNKPTPHSNHFFIALNCGLISENKPDFTTDII